MLTLQQALAVAKHPEQYHTETLGQALQQLEADPAIVKAIHIEIARRQERNNG